MLGFVEEQTSEICLAAVESDGRALYYVKKQTEDICLAAVSQNAAALQYMKDKQAFLDKLIACYTSVKEGQVASGQ